uniref:Amino acid permease/ SLC12A domain-containing protein n=1 Tax=Branchiostoma floridae TaxID=7739 RepID=C3ZIG8_BRAFL|eukprot:XP_002591682.1 hypothetical protein BRAFLDRAFT_80771 [Branchiostoma floridae]
MTVAGCLRNFGGRLLRRKYVDAASLEDSQLARCLNTLDLTLLGVGSTLGAGVYVLTGTVARETAGPSIVLSFLVAAIASILAGLCYAEFGARVPKSGSAYVYSYVTVGELWAFIIGWNMILEYVIGTASVARAWSANFDSLVGNRIENWTRTHMAMHVSGLAEYPDFFSLGLTLVLTGNLTVLLEYPDFFSLGLTLVLTGNLTVLLKMSGDFFSLGLTLVLTGNLEFLLKMSGNFFSLGLTLVLTALLALGVKESTRFNNVFTGLNLCVILFVCLFVCLFTTALLALGLCYAEFGARVPKSGSAYVYSYVTVGELWAFIIGWNMILEYVIALLALGVKESTRFNNVFTGLNLCVILFVCLFTPALLALGVKESTRFNNVFTGLNLCVILFVMVAGFIKADGSNWAITHSQIMYSCLYNMHFNLFVCPPTPLPTCVGEEVKNPQRAIPISIVVSLTICFVAYFGVSSALTLMVPYYTVDKNAPLPAAFAAVGFTAAKYIIAVGAVCALSTSLLGAMFPMPRVIYAMASDGVIFRFLSKVNERTQTPIIATVLSGLLSGTMALLFDLKELVDMMSIGTLQAYTLVAACVLILSECRS